ncbi:WD domain-containing protein [Purpureocillium lilacinum]|uniref:WD domain-containing protein n=1 Tax=Purpureocillium lilacinum TaxID=33203 RepID=A0A179G9B3_PURLI|nr:WD domain-containing protein [Purpureocillium lilacinum]OAQ74405.1 WD domain-containing protein [Purpureocillium lilacinum]
MTSANADGKITCLPERLWDRAYDHLKEQEHALVQAYEKVLSRELHKDTVDSTSSESQQNAIAQHDPAARRDQMKRLVDVGLQKTVPKSRVKEGVGAAMDVVLYAKEIISSAIQAVPQAALPWSGVIIALEMLANPSQETETNRNGIIYVATRMDWYWSLSSLLFGENTIDGGTLSGVGCELEKRIVDLYKLLLLYQMRSVCSYFRNRGLVFLRSVIKLEGWQASLQAIRDAEIVLMQDINMYGNQQTQLHAKNQEAKLENIYQTLRGRLRSQISKEDQQCLRHLRLSDPRHDKSRIERTKGGLLHDSYRWILDNHDFKRWRDQPESRLLWINGDPGKGKTMLLCGIIDELKKSSPPSLLSFFFCQGTNVRINNATDVVRGLIYLLVDQQPSLISHVRMEYDRAGETVFKDANTWDALVKIFISILRDPGLETAYFVIDALDECMTNLPELLDLIVQGSSSTKVKWLLSSRNNPEIKQKLRCDGTRTRLSLELKENAEQISRAVDIYIDDKVSHLESIQGDETLGDKVRAILHMKANDTFLWVALVVHELQKAKSWHILQVVEDVPAGLIELYHHMLKQIQLLQRDAEFCRLMLSTASVAYRPLHLAEIAVLSGVPNQISAKTENVREIVAMCGSFLTVRDDRVYLVHQSAKDFLSGEASSIVFPSGALGSHHAIYSRSLQIMHKTLRRNMYNLSALGVLIDDVGPPDPDPLAAAVYSCVYWVDHLLDSISGRDTAQDDALGDDRVYTFLKRKFLYWLEALSLLRHIPEGVIAMEKLESLVGYTRERRLLDLARDARRFILSHKWMIENAPLQAYVSALLFSPAHSLVKELFKEEEPNWIQTKLSMEEDWNACIQTLEGHVDWVLSVAFSADGQRLASASADRTAKIWDAATGKCVQTLEGHSGRVFSVTFSADGQRLASASSGRTAKIWDAATGKCIQTLEGHDDWIYSVAFSADSQRLASASYDRTVRVWDIAMGKCVQTLEGHDDRIYSVAFSADSQRLVSASYDRTVRVWDIAMGKCVQTLEGHDDQPLENASKLSRAMTIGSIQSPSQSTAGNSLRLRVTEPSRYGMHPRAGADRLSTQALR